MKSISAFAIVSIIAILLAIGLIYFIAKPIKTITTTTTSYIPTTYTETAYIPTTYIITTTYTLTTTYQTPPITITKTITEIITYTYVPEEKIEIVKATLLLSKKREDIIDIDVDFTITNKEFTSIYIDPNRDVTIKGKGIFKNKMEEFFWIKNFTVQRNPFILYGSPYYPEEASFHKGLYYKSYFNPNEIEIGGQYTITFDYKVIYLNGTMSDWKQYSFNITLTEKG